MKRSVGLIVLALLLAAAGGASLLAGRFERRMAVAQEDMAVLDFTDPQQEYGVLEQDLAKLPWNSPGTLREIRRHRAELQYWKRDYASLVDVARTSAAQESAADAAQPDPDLLLLAANASFRTAQHGKQDKATLLKSLDATIRAYGDALRAGSQRPDAAFNYELAVKIRAELANGKRKAMPIGMQTEEKSDANMHGDPGEPPKDMKAEQFQIRIPMDPKDFKSSQEETAGTGQTRRRRG
jgi:hypothetical protein